MDYHNQYSYNSRLYKKKNLKFGTRMFFPPTVKTSYSKMKIEVIKICIYTVINVYGLRESIYLFVYQVFTFYTVKMNTDFENIKNKKIFSKPVFSFTVQNVNTWYTNE